MSNYSRREFGKIALAAVPAGLFLREAFPGAHALAEINSKIKNVQIGAITYSFNTIAQNADDIIKAYVSIGLGEMELMSNHCESLAGAPARGGGRGTQAPEQAAAAAKAFADWRTAATAATFAPVLKKINDAGISLQLLCYNMQDSMTDDLIEYGFMMAKALKVKTITTSTTVTMAKRVVPFAEKHQINVAFHGHDNLADPNQFAKPESFVAAMAMSKYYMVNLDIGHFTSAGYDPIPFIKEHHARISNLHVKDKHNPANGGQNVAWGQGDTPIKQVLMLMNSEKYPFPANIEYEYRDPDGAVAGVGKCFAFIKNALA
jgi:hypothetical protein